MAEQIARMRSQAPLMTADELLRSDVPHRSAELVRGVLQVREPPGTWHGQVSARLLFVLGEYVYPRNAGLLFGQDTGFLIERNPDTVRAADVAFVSAGRASSIERHGYAALAPDLVAEILSPGDRAGEVLEKVAEWLRAGSRLVWLVDTERLLVQVHHMDGTMEIVHAGQSLDGEAVLPGFNCPLRDIVRAP